MLIIVNEIVGLIMYIDEIVLMFNVVVVVIEE